MQQDPLMVTTEPEEDAAVDPDDQYQSVGRLPQPGDRLFPADAEPQRCRTWCWGLVIVLLVAPLIVVLALALVPYALLTVLGLCCGRTAPLLSASGGEPRRPNARSAVPTSSVALRDGRQLEYLVRGPVDGTPAVFIHGYGCSAQMFASDYFSAIFAAHKLRVYSVSLPGFGLSDSLPDHRGWSCCWRTTRNSGRTLAEFAQDVAELADQVIDPGANTLSFSFRDKREDKLE